MCLHKSCPATRYSECADQTSSLLAFELSFNLTCQSCQSGFQFTLLIAVASLTQPWTQALVFSYAVGSSNHTEHAETDITFTDVLSESQAESTLWTCEQTSHNDPLVKQQGASYWWLQMVFQEIRAVSVCIALPKEGECSAQNRLLEGRTTRMQVLCSAACICCLYSSQVNYLLSLTHVNNFTQNTSFRQATSFVEVAWNGW